METPNSDIEQLIEDFRHGQLTEQRLRQALERGAAPRKCQDLLYIEATSTALNASLLGMNLVRNGEMMDSSLASGDWPYATVLDAIRDGWRVVKFPELALLLLEEETTSLGCEFILEKWS